MYQQSIRKPYEAGLDAKRGPGPCRWMDGPGEDETVHAPYVPADVLATHMLAAPGLTFSDMYGICTMSRAALRAFGGNRAQLLERGLRLELPSLCELINDAADNSVRELMVAGSDVSLVGCVRLIHRLHALHAKQPRTAHALCRDIDLALRECKVVPAIPAGAVPVETQLVTLRLLLTLHSYAQKFFTMPRKCKNPARKYAFPSAACLLSLEYVQVCLRRPGDGSECLLRTHERLRSMAASKAREFESCLGCIPRLEQYAHLARLRALCHEVKAACAAVDVVPLRGKLAMETL